MLSSTQSPAATLFDLDRLLSRLEHNVLSETSADPALSRSAALRRKAGANVEFAQTLVLRLERERNSKGEGGNSRTFSGGKVKLRGDTRDELQARLDSARLVIKRLNRRLVELDQLDVPPSPVDNVPPKTMAQGQSQTHEEQTSATVDAATSNEAQLRQRRTGKQDDPSAAGTTQSERTALFSTSTFARRADTSAHDSAAPTSSSKREVVLESNKHEQDILTSSLLDVAKQLKSSTRQFGALLEADREVATQAERGLDKNVAGLEAADRKMGMLRKMTEGKGWLGRMKLYAILAGLWLAAFLLVFVGPKLRF